MTTKGLRYIQIRENAVREAIQSGFITLQHVAGKLNVADLFTKEMKDVEHFHIISSILLQDAPSTIMSQVRTTRVRGGYQTQNPSQVGSGPHRPLPSSHNIT